ncbi:MAG: lamin tail domain-containing protein, partial [Parcubacteria group bacterium]
MQAKNKIKIFVFLFILPLASFFSFKIICKADEKHLIITELLPDPTGSSEKKNEFVEIYNPTSETIDLSDWYFKGKTKTFMLSGEIKTKEYKAFYDTITLYNEKSTVELFNSQDKVDSIEYLDPKKQEENSSYSFNSNDEKWYWTSILTPGLKNIFNEIILPDDPSEDSNYSGIMISEIYPAPDTKAGEEEFVEIINSTGEEIDFSDYTIKDSKGAKGKISKKEKIGNFIVFYGSFSFNNDSKGDTVFLYDKKENLIASQKYSDGKSTHSFSFDGSSWRWTSSPTPGGENFFDKILSGKLILPKKIYKNTYAYFNVKADSDAKKFTWNFGDGHKSYLKSTKHKYEKTGKFSGNLKITGDGEDKSYDFTVKVEKYDAPKIRIVSFSPNPKGSDTKNEWIEIKNQSKDKINLKGWSIATGKDKLINHPIREDFKIKKGKTKKLTKKNCAFTLGNEKTKIELRDPSGKVVQKIKYDRKKDKIAEDEIYEKNDDGWNWVGAQNNTELKQNNTKTIENPLLPLGEGARRADEGTSATTEEN